MNVINHLKEFRKNTRGMALRDLLPITTALVVAGIALSVGASISTSVSTDIPDTCGATSNLTCFSETVGANASDGMLELATWTPTIGLVVAAAIIITVLIKSFQ